MYAMGEKRPIKTNRAGGCRYCGEIAIHTSKVCG
jgi:hypothetical protein